MAEAAIWAIGSVFWCSIFFVAAVSVFWRWWKSPLGRAIVTFDVLLAITLGPACCDTLFGWPDEADYFWQWFTICGFFFDAAAILWRLWVVYRVQAAPEGHILSNGSAVRLLAATVTRRRAAVRLVSRSFGDESAVG